MGSLLTENETGSERSVREDPRVPPPPPPEDPPGGDGGEGPSDPRGRAGGTPFLGNAQLAMVVCIAAELMFFAGLISAFLVFRFSGKPWPPPFQPRYPIPVTAVNTLFLIASSFTMIRAQRALRRGDLAGLGSFLAATGALGVLFLAIQGYEWIRMLGFGLRATSGIYGSLFYTIIGTHGFHVLGGVAWLIAVLIRARRGRYTPDRRAGAVLCGMYWHMVVWLWPVLFVLVYLI